MLLASEKVTRTRDSNGWRLACKALDKHAKLALFLGGIHGSSGVQEGCIEGDNQTLGKATGCTRAKPTEWTIRRCHQF